MKILGSALIIICCGWFGFSLAAAHKKQEYYLRQMIGALDYMQCELQFRLTSLPELCTQVSEYCRIGPVAQFFSNLHMELEQQVSAQVQPCVEAALAKTPKMPLICKNYILQLGKSMGQFDLEGELQGLEAVRDQCRQALQEICSGKDEQRRSYQTLGICAGAALVIVLI